MKEVLEILNSPVGFAGGIAFTLYIADKTFSFYAKIKDRNKVEEKTSHLRCVYTDQSKNSMKDIADTLKISEAMAATLIRTEGYLKTISEKTIETVVLLGNIDGKDK
jgi:hypothetical protein